MRVRHQPSCILFSLLLFPEDALKRCADVEKLEIIEGVFSAQSNNQHNVRSAREHEQDNIHYQYQFSFETIDWLSYHKLDKYEFLANMERNFRM